MNGSLEQMKKHHDLLQSRLSDECGCLEEDWVIGMLFTTIHIEPDGSGHIFIDCGDWQSEKLVPTRSIEELRVAAVDWVNSIPVSAEF